MDKATIKEYFLSRLPQDILPRIPALYLKIIDESIEAYDSGSNTFNGKKPETMDEWYVAVGMNFIAATASLDGVIKGAREAFPGESVNININYRGETQTFHFDSEVNSIERPLE